MKIQETMEKLSTGLRINTTKDDPAGLSISLQSTFSMLKQNNKNREGVVSLLAN